MAASSRLFTQRTGLPRLLVTPGRRPRARRTMLRLDLLPSGVVVDRRPRAERGNGHAAKRAVVLVGLEPLGWALTSAVGAVVVPRTPAPAAGSGPSGPRFHVDFFHLSPETSETSFTNSETALNQLRRYPRPIIAHFSESCFSVSPYYMRFYRIEEHQVTLTEALKESHTPLNWPKQPKHRNRLPNSRIGVVAPKQNTETVDSGRFNQRSRSAGELAAK